MSNKLRITTILWMSVTLTAGSALAQDNNIPMSVYSSAEEQPALIDSTLVGEGIFSLLERSGEGSVTISQPSSVKSALYRHISENGSRKVTGYRVRIYFDNSQDARSRSEAIAASFSAAYPSMRVYRSHVSPYFKVTVGDFRTKADAQRFATSISGQYPSVFLVRESINYPLY